MLRYDSFFLNFPYSSQIQTADVLRAGISIQRLCSRQSLAIQNDGRTEKRYCDFENRKNGTGIPSMTSPAIFATAMPSTRLCENEISRRETATLVREDKKQTNTNRGNGHPVSEKQSISHAEAKQERIAGKISREIKYPFLPTGVTAMYCAMFSSYSVSRTMDEAKQTI